MVSDAIAHAVQGVQRVEQSGLHPHFPCRLLVAGDARRHAVRTLVKAPKVEGVLPHGPALHVDESEYAAVTGDTTKEQAAEAMQQWYARAREEASHLAGRPLEPHRRSSKVHC